MHGVEEILSDADREETPKTRGGVSTVSGPSFEMFAIIVGGPRLNATGPRFGFEMDLLYPRILTLRFQAKQIGPVNMGEVVRFHDETPEIANLYLGGLEEDAAPKTSCLQVVEEPPAPQNDHPLPLPTQEPTADNPSPSSLSFYSLSSTTPLPAPKPIPCTFTEREAILIRNFVDHMALWADITDPQRHFETEVPLRAFTELVLRYAIFAFSSRHLNRQNSNDTTEALQYHNRCVQILIPALSQSEKHITEDLLAAVAILRQHEEMDGVDNQFHLTGTTHILNTVSTFGSSGGLGEAAAWLCLRQDIYVSLTTQQPLRTNLQNFNHSDVFQRDDDFAWSSRMVFLLAKTLQGAFSTSAESHLAEYEVENWYAFKPHTFEPIGTAPQQPLRDQRFPTIWMLLPVHVVGLQYYHIAKIVLALSGRPFSLSPYEALRKSRAIERDIRHHLLQVLGLAQSNARAENTLFTARHSLVSWGWVLRRRADQDAAESLLWDIDSRTGWNMDALIHSLRHQWQDEDGACT
ncbi:hypothetical protein N7492_004622 [Penicillium capsulatum]|uniref:Transcription factor domain-containing protein n=1 Tax=Penicillium capsulatum TaxID=69766 RepID=A0A9W9LQ76_9EURO|nr:hypothetical protein N7492_004622 [Penicillium capsulatum]